MTTHVLDTVAGKPAASIVIELHRRGAVRERLATARTKCRRPVRQAAARLALKSFHLPPELS